MKKDITYKMFQSLTKDKDLSVKYYIDSTLNKTQSMFIYTGLPETLPACELENILQVDGVAFITEVDGKLYAFAGGLGGEPNVYYKPTLFTVANPALKLSKTYDIEADGVLFKNDYLCKGLLPIIGKNAVLLTDCNISLNTAAVLTRLTMLISASDDKTKASAELFVNKLLDGDFSIIGESAFLNGVKMQSANVQTRPLTDLIELMQYYKSNLLAEIGLNSNYNMKRERLTQGETLMNVDDLLPFVENMLTERKNAVEKLNQKYGLNVTVDLKSAWKTEKENADKNTENAETDTPAENPENVNLVENESEQNETNEDSNEYIETKETDEPNETAETDETETEKIVKIIRELRENETADNEETDETKEPKNDKENE